MSKHSNREKEIMLWIGKNYPTARVFRFDSGQAYAKFSVKNALQVALSTFKETRSVGMAMTAGLKRLVVITYGVEGWPDLLVIFMGVAIGLEVKVGKDRQRKSQKNMQNTFNLCGAAYKLVDDKSSLEKQITPVMESVRVTMEKIWQTKQ